MSNYTIKLNEVFIETTSMCTQSCWHCKHGIANVSPRIMPESFVIKAIDELIVINYDRRLMFYSGNEPLLDPRVEDFMRYAAKKLLNARLVLISNGDLASSSVLRRLFCAGMEKILFSLHDKDTQVEMLQELQNEYGKKKVLVVDQTEGNQGRFNNRGGHLKTLLVSQERYPAKGCIFPFRQMVIYSDCKLGLCCVDHTDCLNIDLVDQKSILKVFYEDEILCKYREMLLNDERILAPCKDCSFHGNYYLNEM